MSHQPYMRLVCTSTRSAGAIGPACSIAMTCRACRGRTTNSKAAFVIQVTAYCGPRANRASPNALYNTKARGNSSHAPQQKLSYWVPCVKLPLRTWRRKDSAGLRIANGAACSVDPSNRPERNSSHCVRGGRHYSLQAQGDFRATAPTPSSHPATLGSTMSEPLNMPHLTAVLSRWLPKHVLHSEGYIRAPRGVSLQGVMAKRQADNSSCCASATRWHYASP